MQLFFNLSITIFFGLVAKLGHANIGTVATRQPVGAERFEFLTGKVISSNSDLKSHWDKAYSKQEFIYGKKPAKFLATNFHVIPSKGRVLDVGMGEGRNGVFLASKGFDVVGIDISSIAVKKAEILAKENQTKITAIVADVNEYHFPPKSFDAILSFYYVDRKLLNKLVGWLKPGGYIFYEGFLIEHKHQIKSPEPDEYFLKKHEVLNFFPKFKILKYSEDTSPQSYTSSIIVKKSL
ncbi:MAG: class I SAM-dependent methyltransferase [Bacteriovoracaceae bacterium]|nr:class I SAM-dependent methyltransferase [Bacteriovoracaceae bacterium]